MSQAGHYRTIPKFGVCPVCGSVEEVLAMDPSPQAVGYDRANPNRREHRYAIAWHKSRPGVICTGTLGHPASLIQREPVRRKPHHAAT